MSDANHRETYLVGNIIRNFFLPLDSNFLTPNVIAVIAFFQSVRIKLCNVGGLTQASSDVETSSTSVFFLAISIVWTFWLNIARKIIIVCEQISKINKILDIKIIKKIFCVTYPPHRIYQEVFSWMYCNQSNRLTFDLLRCEDSSHSWSGDQIFDARWTPSTQHSTEHHSRGFNH